MSRGTAHKIACGKPAVSGERILGRRYRLAANCSRIIRAGGRLLDLGCGNGAQTGYFLSHFNSAVGVDIQLEPLRNLRLDAYRVAAAGESLPFAGESFDAVVSFEVLEHVRNPVATLREVHRILKPGGQAVISVPNKWWIFETHGAHLPLLPWNRVPFFSWLPEPLHSRFAKARIYTRKKLAATISAGGFSRFRIWYIRAPMDRAKPAWLRRLLQGTLFSGDLAGIPFLATSHLAVLDK